MSYDPHGAAARMHRRRQKLGPDATCLCCGEADLTMLTKGNRSLLERHHPLGQAHTPEFTVVVCRNCHARLSAHQLDEGVPLDGQRTVLERAVAMLQALIAFLKDVAEFFLALVLKVVRCIAGLDAHHPTWRDQTWAR
jgi:hypothetical protein